MAFTVSVNKCGAATARNLSSPKSGRQTSRVKIQLVAVSVRYEAYAMTTGILDKKGGQIALPASGCPAQRQALVTLVYLPEVEVVADD